MCYSPKNDGWLPTWCQACEPGRQDDKNIWPRKQTCGWAGVEELWSPHTCGVSTSFSPEGSKGSGRPRPWVRRLQLTACSLLKLFQLVGCGYEPENMWDCITYCLVHSRCSVKLADWTNGWLVLCKFTEGRVPCRLMWAEKAWWSEGWFEGPECAVRWHARLIPLWENGAGTV